MRDLLKRCKRLLEVLSQISPAMRGLKPFRKRDRILSETFAGIIDGTARERAANSQTSPSRSCITFMIRPRQTMSLDMYFKDSPFVHAKAVKEVCQADVE